MPVRESLNVLLVDGHFKSEPFQAETDYLAQALEPGGDLAGPAVGRSRPRSSPSRSSRAATWRPTTRSSSATSPSSPRPRSTALDDYLKQGGGVVVFGGDQVIADNYNRLLYADGKGLLPAAVGPSVGDAAKKEAAFGFNPLGLPAPDRRPSSRARPTRSTAGLTEAQTWQYPQAEAAPRTRPPRSRWRSTTATRRSSRRPGTAGR